MSQQLVLKIEQRLRSGIQELRRLADRLEHDGHHGPAMHIREVLETDLDVEGDLDYLKALV